MKTAQLNRRLEKLSATFRPASTREFTLEELCRLYWRLDKRGFRAFVADTPMFQFFLGQFEREDAECAPAGRHRARIGPQDSYR